MKRPPTYGRLIAVFGPDIAKIPPVKLLEATNYYLGHGINPAREWGKAAERHRKNITHRNIVIL